MVVIDWCSELFTLKFYIVHKQIKMEQKLTLKGLAQILETPKSHQKRKLITNQYGTGRQTTLCVDYSPNTRHRLKYPMSLKGDPLWAEEKQYIRKFRLYLKKKLPVQHIYINNGKPFLQGCSQPLVMEQANPQRDDTFDNFDQRKFLQIPTDRFYNQKLECAFSLKNTKPKKIRMLTQPEQTHVQIPQKRQLSPIQRLTRKYHSIRGILHPLTRNRSLTSSVQIDVIRDRRLSKISKECADVKNQISILQEDQSIELDYDMAIKKLREVVGVSSLQPIPKQQVLKKLYEKYGMYPQHVPLRCNRLDEYLHLKTTIENINNVSNYTVHRLAFDFYDFNRNRVIDQEDLLQMLQKGLQMPAIDKDYQQIVNYLAKYDNKIKDAPMISPARSGLSPGLRISRMSRVSNLSQTQETQLSQSRSNRNISPKIWTMLKKQQQPKQLNRPALPPIQPVGNRQISINFSRFQVIFRNKRPQIFYDILKFLFGYEKKTQRKLSPFNNLRRKIRKQPCPSQHQPVISLLPDVATIKQRIKYLKTEIFKSIQKI